MAGEWIKMRGNLWDDPRIGALAESCDCGEAQIIGALYWLWATADQHTEDGVMPGLTRRQIDRKTGVAGFGDALAEIGWIADHPDGLLIVKFEEHNGASAKRRCADAQRKATVRNVSASEADNERTEDGQKTPSCGAREEKRREEKYPPTPLDEIVELYHAKLPTLPRVVLKTSKRDKACRDFWRWIFDSRKSDGAPRAQTDDQALTWISGYFERAAGNDFLMGNRPGKGHENWRADFDFLLTERGRTHVIERTVEA